MTVEDGQSLSRVLEPEVMDSAAEAGDYDAMDHAAVNRLFVTDFLFAALETGLAVDAELPPDARSLVVEILDLGTGTAQIPIELCHRAQGVRVTAVDLAAEMLKVARANVARAGLGDRVQLDRVDAKALPYADGRFDAVMSNSIVHHIPNPAPVLADAARLVRPGGLLFIRDLLRPNDDATVRRLVATYAAEGNDHQRAMFDDSLRAALDLDEIHAIVAKLGFAPESVRATSDRHWTWSARK